MNPILEIKHITKYYKKLVAVDDVSFDVFPGEIFGFLGPNGAGKSTVIKLITGLIPIKYGEIYISGYSVRSEFEKASALTGAIIENPNLFEYLSGRQNLKYFASLHSNITKQRIDEVVKFVGLEGRIGDKVYKYSLGMKQRLGIAQALLHSPKLLILDEPTNGLDAGGIKELRVLLKKLSHEQKLAIMVSSHILSEMENLCDRVGIINEGKLIEVKTMNEIRKIANENGALYVKVSHPNFAGKLVIENFKTDVKILNQNILFDLSEESLAEIIVLLTQKGISVFGAGRVDSSLEEVFLRATNLSAEGGGLI